MNKLIVLLSLVFISLQGFSQNNVILRKPYLQKMAADQVTIKWRTLIPGIGSVMYGTQPGVYTETVEAAIPSIEHTLVLHDLRPSTTYYYQILVGTEELGNTEVQSFTTGPAIGSEEPLHFWVIGDAGTGNDEQVQVFEAYKAFANKPKTNLTLMLGDNAYLTGLDLEYQTNLYDVYDDFYSQVAFYTIFGNHDSYSTNPLTETGAYFSNFELPKDGELGGIPSGTEAYYSFDYGNVHFISLDANMLQSLLKPGQMVEWLEQDLQQNTQKWTIAMWHHPPYTKGSHDSDTEDELIHMREVINPILEAYGVDLGLGGHSHNYERTSLINGHYGMSDSFDPEAHIVSGGLGKGAPYAKVGDRGTMYIVDGNSGGQVSSGNMDHPATVFNSGEPGSLLLDIDGDQLRGRYLTMSGDVIDEFFMQKGPTAVGQHSVDSYQLQVLGENNAGDLSLSVYLPNSLVGSITITDLTGKTVFTQPFNRTSGKQYFDLPTKNLESSLYIITLHDTQGQSLDFVKVQVAK